MKTLVSIIALLMAGLVSAQTYPARQVRIVVPPNAADTVPL